MTELAPVENLEAQWHRLNEETLAQLFEAQDSGDKSARFTEYGITLQHIATVGMIERQYGATGLSHELTVALQKRLHMYMNEGNQLLEAETHVLFLAADAVSRQGIAPITPEMHRDLTVLDLPGQNEFGDNMFPTEQGTELYPTLHELTRRQLVTRVFYGSLSNVYPLGEAAKLALKQRTARDIANETGEVF